MRALKLSSTLLASLLCAAPSGCASPEPPPTQTIQVQTPGCDAASCELSNDRGRWPLARTPGSVTVTVSQQPLRASCRADDVIVGAATASSLRSATSGAGAVTGGVVGGAATGAALGATALAFIPPLGVIAVLTGVGVGAVAGEVVESRNRPLRYPELVSISMNCSTADAASTPAGLKGPRLGLGIRGMTLAQAQAAGVTGRTAVQVISVADDSRAAAAGLRDGDVVLALNGQDVSDAADLEERVLALPGEAPLSLRVWRDRRLVDLVVMRAAKEVP